MNTKALYVLFFLTSNAIGQVTLEPLQEKDIEQGCGCSFGPIVGTKSVVEQQLLVWEADGPAKMRINGQLETLSVSKPIFFRKPEAAQRVGDRLTYELRSSKWLVKVDCKVSKVCAPDDESCESENYMAKLVISSGRESKVVKVTGVCGC